MTGEKFKRQGKHKRGERGSLEEEDRKRLNMASEDNAELPDEETSVVQEPSNLELKIELVQYSEKKQQICQRDCRT